MVAVGRRILPKAQDDAEVRACLKLLSGRRHQVITAVALITPQGKLRTRDRHDAGVAAAAERSAEIEAYVESREGVGKAGGYAIQGRAEVLVKEISGSYSNVVGLPLALTVALLAGGPAMADCPDCGKPAGEAFKPFCSKRCADIDLGRWLKGGYAIPGAPDGQPAKPSDGQGKTTRTGTRLKAGQGGAASPKKPVPPVCPGSSVGRAAD